MFRLALYLTLLVGVFAGQGNGALRTEGFVRALEFKHSLRACNAYPSKEQLDVFRGKERLTSDGAMPYMSCQDFETPLKEGDKLEFKIGDVSQGTFSVAELPQNDAVLMLIVHRHDTLSTATAFESHVFANQENAQVAVIDTYKGKAKSTPQISDKDDYKDITDPKTFKPKRKEELRYGSVVAMDQGKYEVDLLGDYDGKSVSKVEFVALKGEKYIVLRTGVESQEGEAFPQQLMAFPQSDPMKLPHSGSAARTALLAPLLLAAAVALGL